MNNENNSNNNAFSMHDDGNHNINPNVVVPPIPEDTYSKTEMLDVTAIMKSVDSSQPTNAPTAPVTPAQPQAPAQPVEPPVATPVAVPVETPVPTEPVVYDELTGVALHEDSSGLERTIFVKEEPEEPLVKEKKPKSPLFYFLVFLLVLLVTIGVVVAVLFAKSTYEDIEQNKGKTYYFYSAGTVTYGETYPEGYDLLYTYHCEGRKCVVDNFSSDKNYPYAVIYDDGYFIFDYNRGSKVDLNLKKYGYNVKNGKTSLLAIDDKKRLKGFILTSYQNNDVMTCYYSISKKKIVYQTTGWLPYTDSNLMYFVYNNYISLYQEFEETGKDKSEKRKFVKSKLIDFKSGSELGEIVGYYSAYYDSIRNNWYIVAKESMEANAKIKLLKDDRLSYVLPTVQEYQHVGFKSDDKNVVYLTGDNQTYYICDANAGTCETHNSSYVIYDVIDDQYKVIKYNNQYAVLSDNGSPIPFRDYSSQDDLYYDYDMSTYYKKTVSFEGETGVHIYFKNADNEDCLEYYFDEVASKVIEVSNTCKKK